MLGGVVLLLGRKTELEDLFGKSAKVFCLNRVGELLTFSGSGASFFSERFLETYLEFLLGEVFAES